MLKFWNVYPGVLSKETCNEIKRCAMKYPEEVGKIGGTDDRITNLDYRRAQVRFIPYISQNDDFDSIFRFVQYYAQIANKDFGLDISSAPPSNMQFTQYNDWNEGKYDWHHDVFWIHTDTKHMFQRKISLVLQLDDPKNYDGGDFEFHPEDTYGPVQLPDKEVLREQGTIIVFPSFLRHRVTPVTRGIRHSLVYWQEGPLWR